MAKKVYDSDGLDMQNVNWDGDANTDNLPVSGRLVEQYIKHIDKTTKPVDVLSATENRPPKASRVYQAVDAQNKKVTEVEQRVDGIAQKCEQLAPTTELIAGETKAPTAGVVFDALVGAVTDVDVTDSEDGTQYVMTVTQKDKDGGESQKEVRFSKYTDDDKVVVNIDLTDASGVELPSTQYLPLGTGFVIRYAVNIGTAGGSSVEGYEDLKARVIVKRGSTVLEAFKDAEFVGIVAGQDYTFDVSEYLSDATAYTVLVEAQAMYQGANIMKTASAKVTMVDMTMQTTYDVSNGLEEGGYMYDINIPFMVKGTSGEKNIYYRVNGGEPVTLGLSVSSGLQQRNVVVGIRQLKEGANVIEAYAKHEGSEVISEVHYLTVLKADVRVKYFAGIMFSHRAAGFQKDWQNPVLRAEQFTSWNFAYAAYDADNYQAKISVQDSINVLKEDYLSRNQEGRYGQTNVTLEAKTYTVKCGDAQTSLKVEIAPHSDIEAELSPDAVCSFDAFGRENTEQNPAIWKSGDKYMEFSEVLWDVNDSGMGSGWHKNRLLLSNGATMRLTAKGGYHPFNDSEKPEGYTLDKVGMTIEIEYSTANVTDVNAELISCLGLKSDGRTRYGLVVTPEEAKFLTGNIVEAEDGGVMITYEDTVGTKFEPGKNIRITYVFYPDIPTNEQRTLIGFFVNGEESAASKWMGNIPMDIASELTFSSVGADLSIKSVRIYNKALTSDEVLNNYIVDRGHLEDTDGEPGVRSLDEGNRVLQEGDRVSKDKLLAMMKKRGNSVMIIYGTGSVSSETPAPTDTMNVLDALAMLNNKKKNKLITKMLFYNGNDRSLDFVAENFYGRIQGTSSVNYARKNWRFYFQKSNTTSTMSYGEIGGNGQQSNPTPTEGKKNLFRLRANSIGAKLACAKCDFSDSSMTTNTGGAKFINDGLKKMNILTPAQQYAKDHPDTCNVDIRYAIDGTPCDLFAAMKESDDLVYYGQYNLNNEKSDSYPIFGQDKTIGEETWGEGDTINYLVADGDKPKEYLPICIETLNNSNNLCLFRWVPSTEPNHTAFMDDNFDGGFELNHPKDTFWNDGGGDAEEEPNMKEHLGTGDKYDKMYKAIDRMMSFVYACVKETEAGKNVSYDTATKAFTGINYDDVSGKFPAEKWKSAKFKSEAGAYFCVENLAAYYLYVQFNLGVDQLAKNMLIRTWDGVMWYITYYDGDCQLGSDNKSFLTGKYDDRRETMRNGAYVMQGHDSWLWNLMLANMSDLFEKLMTKGVNGGESFKSAFSIVNAIDYFDNQQMNRWCSRLYNKSGIFKYVYPFLNQIPYGEDGKTRTYPQIYGLKGSLKAHRNYFIRRRYELKQVEYGDITTDGASFYQSTASQQAGHNLNDLTFELVIPYRVQVTNSNLVKQDSGVIGADTEHTFTFTEAYNENDPLNIIGANKIKKLVWHDDAFCVGFNMGKFLSLVYLDMSVSLDTKKKKFRNASYLSDTQSVLLLQYLDMTNNLIARNNGNGYSPVLDLSPQGRLRTVKLGGTELERVTFATGAPIEELVLPDTLIELRLENLPKLKEENLTLEGVNRVEGFRFTNCPGIDGLGLLRRISRGGSLKRFSLKIDMKDDGSMLKEFYDYKTYLPNGGDDNEHSGLRGRLVLTKYMEDEEYDKYAKRYPELEIVQVPYTMICFHTDVSHEANITNLDNKTGYQYGNTYQPSGHINSILRKRHRVLAKITKKPTYRMVDIAGGKYAVNNTDGEMTYFPLHDSNSYFYADADNVNFCSTANLDGTQGDVMMYEPFYWSKGVNDVLNNKNYACYCQFPREKMPPKPNVKVLNRDGLDGIMNDRKIVPDETLDKSFVTATGFSVCKVKCDGYQLIRIPAVLNGSGIFVDTQGKVVSHIFVNIVDDSFSDGDYVIARVPENASECYWTISNSVEFDKVVLSETDDIANMEPDWVANDEYLCGVFKSSLSNGQLSSCLAGAVASDNKSWVSFHNGSQSRGMQQIDYIMHSRIANLAFAKYGRRDMQAQCGGGQSSWTRKLGGTAKYGMTDTIGYEEASKIAPVPSDVVDGVVHPYGWYNNGEGGVIQIVNTCCLGYEDVYGHKYDMMDCIDIPNDSGRVGYYRIFMPDGSIRFVKGATVELWITKVYHGKYMDMIPVGRSSSTSTTGYTDKLYFSGSPSRVVYRGGSDASAYCGVSYTNTWYDSSSADAHIGSRLAFRGKIVRAESVEAYEAIR